MASRARVAVLISGRGSNMAALLYAAKADDCPFEIALVTGDKPDAPGLALAEAEGIAVARLSAKDLGKDVFFDTLDRTLRDSGVEYIALAGFMRIVPESFIGRWTDRILNIHPSLLPKYAGLHPQQQALDDGAAVSGATVHIVNKDLDAGPVVRQREVPVLPGDTARTLADRILEVEHALYPEAIAAMLDRADL